jgi:hypothetical protein
VPDLLLFVLQDAQKLRKHGTSIPEYAREEGVALLKVLTTLSCKEAW